MHTDAFIAHRSETAGSASTQCIPNVCPRPLEASPMLVVIPCFLFLTLSLRCLFLLCFGAAEYVRV